MGRFRWKYQFDRIKAADQSSVEYSIKFDRLQESVDVSKTHSPRGINWQKKELTRLVTDLLRELLEDRRDHPTRPAPVRVEVDDDGQTGLGGVLLHEPVEFWPVGEGR